MRVKNVLKFLIYFLTAGKDRNTGRNILSIKTFAGKLLKIKIQHCVETPFFMGLDGYPQFLIAVQANMPVAK